MTVKKIMKQWSEPNGVLKLTNKNSDIYVIK